MRTKYACVNCHFLTKHTRLPGRDKPSPFEVNQREREAIRKEDYSPFEHTSLACDYGVWDEGYNFDRARRYEVIVETNRKNFCFFWSYRPGMLFPAAKILQEREAADHEASRDRRFTVIGLWTAVIALSINVLIEFAKVIGWI